MESDEIRFSPDFAERMAERERVRFKIQEAIKSGLISVTGLYESQSPDNSDDLSF
jgi:hypothetical protein